MHSTGIRLTSCGHARSLRIVTFTTQHDVECTINLQSHKGPSLAANPCVVSISPMPTTQL